MNFIEFLSPLLRRKKTYLGLVLLFSISFFGLFQLIPPIHKTTVYFPVKPLEVSETSSAFSLDPAESTSKITEMIAGWAKNPGFRQEILDTAKIYIPHLKRKLSARKQNRMNVFWTIKLYGTEIKHSEKITQALLSTFEKNFEEFNNQRAIKYGTGTPSVFHETTNIPFSWLIAASIFFGLLFSFLGIYFSEAFGKKVSFVSQVSKIFPKAPTLKISAYPESLDSKLLEQFILTFPSASLIGTFPTAETHFPLSDDIIEQGITPILLVKLGETSTYELENMKAIHGKKVGIVIFEK